MSGVVEFGFGFSSNSGVSRTRRIVDFSRRLYGIRAKIWGS